MKRLISIFLIALLSSSIAMQAQQSYFMGKKNFDTDIKVGAKVGVNFAKMFYTDDRISDLHHDFKPRILYGVTAEIPLNKVFSISPELLMVDRGTYTEYTNRDGLSEVFTIKSNHFDVRVPFLINVPINKKNRLYVYFAPDLAFTMGGTISVSNSDLGGAGIQSASIGKSNMAPVSFSVIGGGGCRFNIKFTRSFYMVMRVEAGYNYGIIDTYSQMEKDGSANPINVGAYEIKGNRMHRGIEAALVLLVPLNTGDAFCK